MAFFVEAEDLLDLRLGLEHEILGRAAAEDEDAGVVAVAFGVVDDAGGLVDVAVHIELQFVAREAHGGDVHADGTVAGAAGEAGDGVLVGDGDERGVFEAEFAFALVDVFAEEVVKFVGAHGPLEFAAADDLADEGVGVEEDGVIEEDVVDADDVAFAELDVVEERRAAVELHVEAIMDVVVEVGAGGDDPVDEARFDEGDEAGFAEAGGHEGAREADPDQTVAGQHLLREQFAALAETGGVVGLEGVGDELGCAGAPGGGPGVEAREAAEFADVFHFVW